MSPQSLPLRPLEEAPVCQGVATGSTRLDFKEPA